MTDPQLPDEVVAASEPGKRIALRSLLLVFASALIWTTGTVLAAVTWSIAPGLVVMGLLGGFLWAMLTRLLPEPDRKAVEEIGAHIGQIAVKLYSGLLAFGTMLFLPAGCYFVARWVTNWGWAPGRLAGLSVLLVLLLWLVLAITLKSSRDAFFKDSPLWATTVGVTLMIGALASAVFAGFTMELVDRGWIDLTPKPSEAGQLADFYAWHLINAIPGNPLETLKWGPPYAYDQPRVGALVLFYTLVVVGPVIRFVQARLAWRKAGSSGPSGTTSGRPVSSDDSS